MPRYNTVEGFWARVAKSGPEDCWPFDGRGRTEKYGKFTWKNKTVSSHRFAYALTHGTPIAAGGVNKDTLNVCHICDYPSCCNPAHLFLGTQLDNRRDCAAKGRTASGEANGLVLHPESVKRGSSNWIAKLVEADIPVIRGLLASGHSKRRIARRFGVSPSLIRFIEKEEIWKHV